MTWENSSNVRKAFIDYFVNKRGHKFIKSSSVVPFNDPTLLFINAGMNQFKPVLLGQCDQTHPFYGLKRAVNSQKCIRAGGKHNDLDDVGKDTYHHTFFEMLGNWSFGDYFKKEAIGWAFELLTSVYGLDPKRMYVTYFGGDPKEPGVPIDEEAKAEWLKYLPAERVLPFGMKENFWEMGETGPCGPCSEIHYDRLDVGRNASELVNRDDPNVIEIWNNVFMQFNREKDRSLSLLPAVAVDTGMGFERLASILAGVPSNYDIDIFRSIFAAIKEQCPPETPEYRKTLKDPVDIAYRVVADHARTLTIALSDGAVPSNQDRGYVLRRIVRRAVRYGKEILKAKDGFLCCIVDAVVVALSAVFPEIAENKDDVKAILLEEEMQFLKTLDKGRREFDKIAKSSGAITGEDAFKLYSTYGFPLDLTQIMASEHNMSVDVKGFTDLMERFREQSRDGNTRFAAAGEGEGTAASVHLGPEEIDYLTNTLKLEPTDDSNKYSWDSAKCEFTATDAQLATSICAIFDPKSRKFIQEVPCGFKGALGIVLKGSSFYAEGGGQVGDCGKISATLSKSGDVPSFVLNVVDTQKFGPYLVHVAFVESCSNVSGGSCSPKTKAPGSPAPQVSSSPKQGASQCKESCGSGTSPIHVGSAVVPTPNLERRGLIAKNHTATHILNFALRQVLGDKCDQKGSLVNSDKLRFDFGFSRPVSPEELQRVEEICNEVFAKKMAVYTQVVPLKGGLSIKGLRAVFGETYPDPVRLVSVGAPLSGSKKSGSPVNGSPTASLSSVDAINHSVEFCGGTHVGNSSEIFRMYIITEEGIAKGIRRLVAVTGKSAASEMSLRQHNLFREVADACSLVGAAQAKAIGDLRTALNKSEISVVTRRALLAQVDKAKEDLIATQKASSKDLQAVANALVESLAKELTEGSPAKSKQVIVRSCPELKGDSKMLSTIVDSIVKKVENASVFLVSGSCCAAAVGSKGTRSAKEWINHVTTAYGSGRGGGSDKKAQAQFPEGVEVNADSVVNAATSYSKRNHEHEALLATICFARDSHFNSGCGITASRRFSRNFIRGWQQVLPVSFRLILQALGVSQGLKNEPNERLSTSQAGGLKPRRNHLSISATPPELLATAFDWTRPELAIAEVTFQVFLLMRNNFTWGASTMSRNAADIGSIMSAAEFKHEIQSISAGLVTATVPLNGREAHSVVEFKDILTSRTNQFDRVRIIPDFVFHALYRLILLDARIDLFSTMDKENPKEFQSVTMANLNQAAWENILQLATQLDEKADMYGVAAELATGTITIDTALEVAMIDFELQTKMHIRRSVSQLAVCATFKLFLFRSFGDSRALPGDMEWIAITYSAFEQVVIYLQQQRLEQGRYQQSNSAAIAATTSESGARNSAPSLDVARSNAVKSITTARLGHLVRDTFLVVNDWLMSPAQTAEMRNDGILELILDAAHRWDRFEGTAQIFLRCDPTTVDVLAGEQNIHEQLLKRLDQVHVTGHSNSVTMLACRLLMKALAIKSETKRGLNIYIWDLLIERLPSHVCALLVELARELLRANRTICAAVSSIDAAFQGGPRDSFKKPESVAKSGASAKLSESRSMTNASSSDSLHRSNIPGPSQAVNIPGPSQVLNIPGPSQVLNLPTGVIQDDVVVRSSAPPTESVRGAIAAARASSVWSVICDCAGRACVQVVQILSRRFVSATSKAKAPGSELQDISQSVRSFLNEQAQTAPTSHNSDPSVHSILADEWRRHSCAVATILAGRHVDELSEHELDELEAYIRSTHERVSQSRESPNVSVVPRRGLTWRVFAAAAGMIGLSTLANLLGSKSTQEPQSVPQ